ncbi:MAG: hypothetical protein ACYCZU_06230 [Devosia sp.]
MTTILSTLKNTGRAAVLAIVLAGTALGAMPAQAAPLGAFKLELQAAPKGGEMQMKKFGYEDDYDWCLTNRQIRKGLKKAGFTDIDFVQELKKHRVRVEALYLGDDWYYSMRINRCSGHVDKIKKLYPAYEDDEFDIEF